MSPAAGDRAPDLDLDLVMAVGMAGALGSALRWLLAEVWPVLPGEFPWSTIIVNVVGSAALGVLVGLRPSWPLSRRAYHVLSAGLLGGFTTFSTYALQGVWMLERGQLLGAAGWLVGCVVAALVAAALGWSLGRRLSPHADAGPRVVTDQAAPDPDRPELPDRTP